MEISVEIVFLQTKTPESEELNSFTLVKDVYMRWATPESKNILYIQPLGKFTAKEKSATSRLFPELLGVQTRR